MLDSDRARTDAAFNSANVQGDANDGNIRGMTVRSHLVQQMRRQLRNQRGGNPEECMEEENKMYSRKHSYPNGLPGVSEYAPGCYCPLGLCPNCSSPRVARVVETEQEGGAVDIKLAKRFL